jgi:hypothetical protein
MALNWHSYGRFINVPWAVQSHAQPPAGTAAALSALAAAMAAAGTTHAARASPPGRFGYGHPYDGGLYSCNGEASDWMLAAAGVLAYSPELGPEFEREPFDVGMWPPGGELAGLVEEGMAMGEAAAWRAGALVGAAALAPTLSASEISLRLTLHNEGARAPAGAKAGAAKAAPSLAPSSRSCACSCASSAAR